MSHAETESRQTVESLLARIHRVFPISKSNQVQAELSESTGHPETVEIRALLREKNWDDVADAVYLGHCPSPFVVGEACLLYYLPGLVTAALLNPESDLSDRLVTDILRPPTLAKDFELFCRRFAILTCEQRKCISQVLEYFRVKHYSYSEKLAARISDSIARYWGSDPAMPEN